MSLLGFSKWFYASINREFNTKEVNTREVNPGSRSVLTEKLHRKILQKRKIKY